MNTSALKVQEYLRGIGVEAQIMEMPATTRTAKEAADGIGCSVAQIAKSIVFRATTSGQAILVIASGVHRVNERRLAELVGEPIEKASADFVREATGFVIGGVPPAGHRNPIKTWIDRDLLQFEMIWAAAGTPFAVFSIAPERLQAISGGVVESIT